MDLENYINDLEIDSSDLMDIPEVKVEMETYVKELAELLKDCIQYYLDLYYDAEYYPSVYHRTNGLRNSLRIDDFVSVTTDAQSLTISLSFDDNLSWGNSLWNSSDGYKILLIDQGWHVQKNVWFKNIEHFGWQNGANFIENGIKEFLSEVNDSNVHVYLDGEEC